MHSGEWRGCARVGAGVIAVAVAVLVMLVVMVRGRGEKICPRVSLLVLIVWGKRNLVLRLNYLLVLLLSSESIEIDISIS